ncbi:MAG: hypothetical protein AAF529_21810 [Pseudomonadota bacterium]
MKIKIVLTAASILFCSGFASATPITIGDPPSVPVTVYQEGDYQLIGLDGATLDAIGQGNTRPAIRVFRGSDGPKFSVSRIDGGAFNLLSFEARGASNPNIQAEIRITAQFANGLPDAVLSFFPGTFNLGPGTPFQTFFPSLTGLVSAVFWSDGQVQPSNLGVYDNVVVSSVAVSPPPIAVTEPQILFTLVLFALIGGMVRRRRFGVGC